MKKNPLFTFLKAFRGRIIIALGLTCLLAIIGMTPPLIMRRLINRVVENGRWDEFPLLISLFFILPVLNVAFGAWNSLFINKIGQGIIFNTRTSIFERLLRLSIEFHDKMGVGALKERMFGDVATISGIATGGLMSAVADTVIIAVSVTMMIQMSVPLTLVTFGLLPLYFLNYRFFSKRIRGATALLRTRMDHVSSELQEKLSGHELILSFGQDEEESERFLSLSKQIMEAALKGNAYSISFNQLASFFNRFGNTVIYSLGCLFFLRGTMNYGDVVAFCAYAVQLFVPVVRFATIANQFTQARVSAERIREIMESRQAIIDPTDSKPLDTLQGDIDIHGVTFGYSQDDESVINGLNLHIPAGADVVIVGTKGSGKSTLAKLLRRFYDPDSGSILVNNTDIRDYRLSDYRRTISMVLPESAILDGTIAENLAYGKPDVEERRIVEISRAVGLHLFVEQLSGGYRTRLGTGGLKLSTGNRQRIGIARALLSDPFILIIDEATAVLDPEAAEEINTAIRKIMRDKTCILIASRALLIKNPDIFVVLDSGKVAESGTFQGLISNKSGALCGIVRNQYGEDVLGDQV